MVAFFPSVDLAGNFCQVGLAFRRADFKKLLNAGQTLGHVITGGDAAGAVLGVQAKLGAGLADTLGGDDADRVVARLPDRR